MFESRERSYGGLIGGMLIGGCLAALTTFMFGTSKGKKIQKQLQGKMTHFRKKMAKVAKSPTAQKVKRAVKKAIKRKKVAKTKRGRT